MKILKMLMKVGELNVSEVTHRLNVNFAAASRHLKALEAEGILLHKKFGRIRLYRINEQSPRARAVLNLIETWERSRK